MKTLTLDAPAKINLTLDILGKRPDGYHDLQMVMQSISLCDTVAVETAPGSGEIAVSTQGAELPSGPENLAWKAAQKFLDDAGLQNISVKVHLDKRIPMQAGMAGGSADAAAVLRGLRTLVCPEFPDERLEIVGAQVGSDVPFCVRGGTALAEGRGERLTNLNAMPHCWIVVCKPEFGLSTPELFGRVHTDVLQKRPDTAGVIAALRHGDLSMLSAQLCNVFEEVLLPQERQEIVSIEEEMRRGGALNALMTGSGPTVFGLFTERDDADNTVQMLRRKWRSVYLAEPI